MAPSATARVNEALRPSLRLVGGSERKPDRRTELEDLRDEVTALEGEQKRIADELDAFARRVEFSILADRSDVALHVVGRMTALAASLRRRGEDFVA